MPIMREFLSFKIMETHGIPFYIYITQKPKNNLTR